MSSVSAVKNNLVVFGNKYPKHIKSQLTSGIDALGYKIIPADIGGFKSGERFCELYPNQKELFIENKQEIQGSQVHLIMNMTTDMNKSFVDMINTIETIKEYGAHNIHAILAFAPYARQDRHFDKRMVSMMAKTFPKHLKYAGADQITTLDVHSKDAEKFYTDQFGEGNVHFISAVDAIYEKVQEIKAENDCVKYGAPDGGDKPQDVAQRKARAITRIAYGQDCVLQDNMFSIIKRHTGVSTTEIGDFQGDVNECIAVELDDMTDTGGTLVNGAEKLKEKGAKQVIAAVTHGIFSGSSLSDLTSDTVKGKTNPIDFIVTTDSILSIYNKVSRLPEKQKQRVHVVPTAPLIIQALNLN